MIRAVTRALAVLDSFDGTRLSMPLHEIGERIGMSKATTFRLVQTLERSGLLFRLDNMEYCLSLKFVRLAGMVRSTITIREIARPIMAQINELTGETITLNTVSGAERICIDVVDTPAPLMAIVRPGDRIPLTQGATGRILFAHMKPEEREQVLTGSSGSYELDSDNLERDLVRYRKQGFALTRGQRIEGVTAIAVPLRGLNDVVKNCIALTGPSIRVDPREAEFITIMLRAGSDISERLGGTPDR